MGDRTTTEGRTKTLAIGVIGLTSMIASAGDPVATDHLQVHSRITARAMPRVEAKQSAVVTEETVRGMLDALVEVILERHHPTRHWEPIRPPSGQSPQPTGRTALAVLALLDAGIPAQSPRIAAAIDWMSTTPADGTYAIAARLMVWCRLPDFDRARRLECERLLERFSVEGGGWDYGPSPRLGFIDQSLTQFGLQAITEAAQRGASIPAAVFDRVRARFIGTQNPDGGWGYRRIGDPSRGSMTAAGVASLAIIEKHLPSRRDDRRRMLDAMTKAVTWLEARFDVEANPGCPRWHLYWIHAMERAARMTGVRTLGTRDWFQESAAMIRRRLFLVEPRHPPRIRGTPRIDRLAFALLVLRRGLEPVAFACIDVGDRPPIDDLLGDACRLVSEHLERVTGWIRIDLDDPPESWRRFPVLVVRSPVDAAWLADPSSRLARRLAAFVASGGVVIALPSSIGPGTRTFPERAIAAIVPEAGNATPPTVARDDPARRRAGRWRIDARHLGSHLRRWCVAARVPLRPGALVTRVETELTAMLASICLERTAGRLPCRIPPSIEGGFDTTADPTTAEHPIRRVDWSGDGLVEPMLLHAWQRFGCDPSPEPSQDTDSTPASEIHATNSISSSHRRLVWLSGIGDADPADLGHPDDVFDPTREFLVTEAMSPEFRVAFIAWIRGRGWRVGLPPAGAPPSCAGLHHGGRCIGVLIDDRPARRLLDLKTPPDFTAADLKALHRSIEAARAIDRREGTE